MSFGVAAKSGVEIAERGGLMSTGVLDMLDTEPDVVS
jgi:hypothetical protein